MTVASARALQKLLSDADVIAAIRQRHLTYNVSEHESHGCLLWDGATVDPGGSIFGPGPYLKVSIADHCPTGWGGTRQRVYAPARLRRRLAAQWKPAS